MTSSPNRLLKNDCGGPSAVLRGVGSLADRFDRPRSQRSVRLHRAILATFFNRLLSREASCAKS